MSEGAISEWKTKNQAEIERLKGQLQNDRIAINTALESLSLGQERAQERRLDAVEDLWDAILKIREHAQPAINFYELLYPEEYDKALDNPKIMSIVSDVDEEYVTDGFAHGDDLERMRPYLGENLWHLFVMYRAVLGRMTLFIAEGKREGQIQNWREDDLILSYLEKALDEDNLDRATEQNSRATRVLIDSLEGKVIEEMSLVISGRRSSRESYKTAQKLRGEEPVHLDGDESSEIDEQIRLLKFMR